MAEKNTIINADDPYVSREEDPEQRRGKKRSDADVKRLWGEINFRIIPEKNDFMLPQVIDFVEKKQWMNLRPEYQRRQRWDDSKKSLLIESLLMNVPIPPVFLYEFELARYEVMDGQQRLNAILEFLNDDLELRGLEVLSMLEGRRHSECPHEIRRTLDRCKISAVILQANGNVETADQLDVRHYVFKRLNTGGQPLNQQEIRNALYSGSFNKLLLKLSRLDEFTATWDIPPYQVDKKGKEVETSDRKENTLYSRMFDCQLVLRFFALREKKHIKGSVSSILDECMRRYRNSSEVLIDSLRKRFKSRLALARYIFGADTFRLNADGGKPGRLSSPLYDAVMVALDGMWDQRDALRENRSEVKKRLKTLLADASAYEVIVGRPNTAKAIQKRIDAVRAVFENSI